jgi:hypothetical protein
VRFTTSSTLEGEESPKGLDEQQTFEEDWTGDVIDMLSGERTSESNGGFDNSLGEVK